MNLKQKALHITTFLGTVGVCAGLAPLTGSAERRVATEAGAGSPLAMGARRLSSNEIRLAT